MDIALRSLQEHVAEVFPGQRVEDDFSVITDADRGALPAEPYRTEMYGACLWRAGTVGLRTGVTDHVVVGPAAIAMGPSVIRSWHARGGVTDSSIVFFTPELFAAHDGGSAALATFDFFHESDRHVLALDAPALARIDRLYVALAEAAHARRPYHQRVVGGYVVALAYELQAVDRARPAMADTPAAADAQLMRRFRALVARDVVSHREVGYYAHHLYLSTKHLSARVRAASGRSAASWIAEALVLEARVRLDDESASVAEVAYSLSFSDPSAFGKFFRRHVGQTPGTYRAARAAAL